MRNAYAASSIDKKFLKKLWKYSKFPDHPRDGDRSTFSIFEWNLGVVCNREGFHSFICHLLLVEIWNA